MTRFVTRLDAIGDRFDNLLAMTVDDVRAWVAAGRPPMTNKQHNALARTLAYGKGEDPAKAVQLAKTIRSAYMLARPPASPASPVTLQKAAWPPSPSRTPDGPASSRPTPSGRTAGNPPKGSKKISKAARKALKRAKRVARSLAAGEPLSPADVPLLMAQAQPELRDLYLASITRPDVRTLDADPEEAAIMLDAPAELRALWLAQSVAPEPEPDRSGPLGMDRSRLELHERAKQLAQTRCDANPRLDPADAYSSAAVELADRDSGAIWLS
jgi:hypothetical protein